jgi:hypothetical protein
MTENPGTTEAGNEKKECCAWRRFDGIAKAQGFALVGTIISIEVVYCATTE